MEELLKTISKSDLLTEETIEKIKEHLASAEKKAEDKAKKVLEAKYRSDMSRLMAATDAMITDGIKQAVLEMREDRSALRRATAKAARAQTLAEQRARASAKAAVTLVESVVEERVKEEIREFSESRRLYNRRNAKALREAQARSDRDREAFAKRGAIVLETLVEKMLRPHLAQLHEDINEAKKLDFGRRIMEAFEAEFTAKHFKANKMFRALSKKTAGLQKQLAEARSSAARQVAEANEAAAAAKKQSAKLVESIERSKKMNACLASLTGEPRKQMRTLLEGVATKNIEKTFKQFLPEVVKAAGREKLAGGTPRIELREGNKAAPSRVVNEMDRDLVELRRRSGIV